MRRDTNRRPGVTTVEAAIVLGVLFVLVFGMLDLGILVFRQHVLSAAARHASRNASLHGSKAVVPWGPVTAGPAAASDGAPAPTAVRPHLFGLNPAEVTVKVEWPDGSNEPGDRVRVTLTSDYQHIMATIFGATPRRLTVTSTVPISH
jgi:Flp pilus assembly protein TadG